MQALGYPVSFVRDAAEMAFLAGSNLNREYELQYSVIVEGIIVTVTGFHPTI
jgi:hypothetical protein